MQTLEATVIEKHLDARRLFLNLFHADFDGEGLSAASFVNGAGGGRAVDVITAAGDADMVLGDAAAIGRVETAPANMGEVDFCPGMGGVRLNLILVICAGVDVAHAVAGRDAEKTREANKKIGEVLTDTFSRRVNLERRRRHQRAARDVFKVAIDSRVDVVDGTQEIIIVPLDKAHRIGG